jgi:signal transduction histidine kinase
MAAGHYDSGREHPMPRRVLCIEGDEDLRSRVRAALEPQGFAVDVSASGLEGIARALTSPPDLVLADVHLPDIEGWELAARLKRERLLKDVPFVALGASQADHDLALAAGADGFVAREASASLPDELRAFLAGKRETLPEEGERAQLRELSGSMATRLESALTGARRASARVEELDRLRAAFTHNLAHELSTPLTPLAGYLRILAAGKLGALSPQQQRIVGAMVQSVARLTRVVDNLADFASLEAGQALLHGEVEPDRMADEVVEELKQAIREARLHVEVLHAGGGAVVADPRKLRQALANLAQNAVKFSPHGGEILVEVTRDPDRLRFVVYDQGPGIRQEELERIFEPLYHAAASRGDDARLPGTGLGLPVARRIAEAHGGRVTVESPPRTQPASLTRHFTGAKFILEIPAIPVDRARAGAGAVPAQTAG